MFARVIIMNGPRSPELVAAFERAGGERIMPSISSDPVIRAAHRGTYVLRRADGGQLVFILSETAEALDRAEELAHSVELLPDEDPALLREPDSADVYEVVHAFDRDYHEYGDNPASAVR